MVEHPILLHKLKILNINSSLLLWIADFLRNRLKYITYNGTISPQRPVRSRVIQGSVIGPTLFIRFIKDLPSNIVTYHLELFIDNSKVIAPIRDAIDRQKVQLDLLATEKWSQENHLPLCTEKSVCLRYSQKIPNTVMSLLATLLNLCSREQI